MLISLFKKKKEVKSRKNIIAPLKETYAWSRFSFLSRLVVSLHPSTHPSLRLSPSALFNHRRIAFFVSFAFFSLSLHCPGPRVRFMARYYTPRFVLPCRFVGRPGSDKEMNILTDA